MSKKLEKTEFIPLLKEFSLKLDENEIRNEIPFVYRNKDYYDYIKIIIPHETDISKLEDIFKSSDYQSINRYIDFYYKDFRFILIRAPETEFFNTFFYYSWDILPTLMNVMLNKMGLDLFPGGLRYIAGEKSILVSNNVRHILEYLDLDFDIYMKRGFKSLFDEVSYITTSLYFNVDIFKEYKLNEKDIFYFDKKIQYDYAMSLFSDFENIKFDGYKYNKDLNSYLMNINDMFPDSNFLENVTKSMMNP